LDLEEAPASALVWTYYYLAQHYDYLENTDMALKYIDKAISHTPTLPELYMTKARIYKHMGNYSEAAESMDEARELDTADRCVNSKSAKYHLRANHIDTALNIVGSFVRVSSNMDGCHIASLYN
jgi:peptide alpha-N-acetyltransferase